MGNCTSGLCNNFNPNKRRGSKKNKTRNRKSKVNKYSQKKQDKNENKSINSINKSIYNINTIQTEQDNKNRDLRCLELNIDQCTDSDHINECRWDPFASSNVRIINLQNSEEKGRCVGISKVGIGKPKRI